MEDSEFSTDFASSFLNWDEHDDDVQVSTTSPSPAAAVGITANIANGNNNNNTSSVAQSAAGIAGGTVLPAAFTTMTFNTSASSSPAASVATGNGATGVALIQQQQQQQQQQAQQQAQSQQQPAHPQQIHVQGGIVANATVNHHHHQITLTTQNIPGSSSTATYATLPQHLVHSAYATLPSVPHALAPSAAPQPATTNVAQAEEKRQAPRADVASIPAPAAARIQQQSHQGNGDASAPVGAAQIASTTTASLIQSTAAPNTNSNITLKAPQLHPLGIQSSANCPPHVAGTLPAVAAAAAVTNTSLQTNPSLLPLLYNPLLHHQASATVPPGPQLLGTIQQQPTASATAAPSTSPQPRQQDPPQAQQQPQQLQQQQQPQQQLQQNVAHAPASVQTNAVAAAPVPAASITVSQRKTKTAKQSKSSRSSKSKSSKSSSSQDQQVPPFYLFDAPCELRANFIQSQRMHNLPVAQDSNAYHYGMAVNGFHPQLNAQVNPVLPLSATPQSILPPGVVQLVDARSKRKQKTGKERNEREQKRAQKITELIDKLRVSMEKGGWKVEMKSKYHTLSTCADYVKHLMQTTKEKEEAVEQAKTDLEIKERKLEDKALNEARSDPESVTSSLTASTARSSSEEKETDALPVAGKRKAPEGQIPDNKKTKVDTASGSSADSSSVEEVGSGSGPEVKQISLDKTASSVSDITNSNRGSSEEGRKPRRRRSGEDESGLPSTSSFSSTAAVARGAASRDREEGHAVVVVKVKRRNQKETKESVKKETTSLDSDFYLDYEEVFLTSNVPQLLATTAGHIVAYNDFFLKATGLSREEVQRLTIFSIVQPDKLSNFFELVAEALRESNNEETPKAVSDSGSSSSSSGHTTGASGESGEQRTDSDLQQEKEEEMQKQQQKQKMEDYAAMTLPCVAFPSRRSRGTNHHPNPLYMTVTLMSDEDPRKRCFHCALTDSPGTNGTMRFVTPELLAMLFTERIAQDVVGPNSSSDKVVKASPNEGEESGELSENGEADLDDMDDQAIEE